MVNHAVIPKLTENGGDDFQREAGFIRQFVAGGGTVVKLIKDLLFQLHRTKEKTPAAPVSTPFQQELKFSGDVFNCPRRFV